MDLRLEEVLLSGAGAAPTVTVKCDPGAAVPSTGAALEGCRYRWSLLAVLVLLTSCSKTNVQKISCRYIALLKK